MYKVIPAAFAVIALGAVAAVDYLNFSKRSVALASLQDAPGVAQPLLSDGQPSYFDHLLSRVGLGTGLPAPSEAITLAQRDALRAAPLTSYMPTPSEDILAGWERINWDDSYHTGFGWPDGMQDGPGAASDLQQTTAIYLKGRSSIFLQIERAEPTEILATRLKQSYWVVATGRDLDRLREGRPRASYFMTNVAETANGSSVVNAIEPTHFAQFEGVHFISAKSAVARRDETMRYVFAALGGGVVIKLRAHAPEADIKAVLAALDFDSLNLMQTLPSPLIASGLPKVPADTPEAWLVTQGYQAAPSAAEPQTAARPVAQKGGFSSSNCIGTGVGKRCKIGD
ncbi:hypothetical protein N6L24_07500 [Cognatishimia sp. SS12]|uniref:hypothetical protein n=1 Tax=Cognatishimia sp. SS12 TaxID=2979465 RepID=UPI00232F4DE6|nr:hypothetical protein [Cognatishimia sp. SS12]MDC0738119.1 hypothetical protein [Cognatishimia sp. SS12]